MLSAHTKGWQNLPYILYFTLMELKEGTTSPAYTQPILVMNEGVKKHSSVGTSNQLSVMLSTRSYRKMRGEQVVT